MISVALISFNEETNIGHTLASLEGVADEIIVVDSFSTDNTVKIAESYGAKVFQEEWKGFGRQKNSALEKCSGDWVLSLDCDEVLTDEVKKSILEAAECDKYNGYRLKRRTFYMGKLLKYMWQPDMPMRFVRKGAAAWDNAEVHETLSVQGKTAVLDGYALHYSYKDFDDHMRRIQKYAAIASDRYLKKGRNVGIFTFLLGPLFTFFKFLILKRAILDGIPGVIAAMNSAISSYIKYAYLWEKKN